MRARVLRAAAMAAGVGVCGLAIGSPAFAVVATVPTPTWQTNGRVNVIVIHGNRAYLGGQFTSVRPAGAPAGSARSPGTTSPRSTSRPARSSQWNPNANGTVRAIQVVGKTVYLGGSFTQVGGVGRARLAAVNTTHRRRDAVEARRERRGARLRARRTATLYVGGGFTTVGGSARAHLAAFSTTHGRAAGWAPVDRRPGEGARRDARTARGVVVGGLLHAGERHVGHSHIAAINPGAGGSLASWAHASQLPGHRPRRRQPRRVRGRRGRRRQLRRPPADGATMWQGGTNGNVQAIGVVGGIVYVGGHYQTTAGRSTASTPARTRSRATSCSRSTRATGDLLSWAPGADSALGVFALTGIRHDGQPVLGRRLPAHRQPRPAGVRRVRELGRR